jgi:hypothetical protein
MPESQLELKAQSALQEFDDACDNAETDPVALGRNAVNALDELITFWNEKSFMQDAPESNAQGGDNGLRGYGDRQIQWATHEKERVSALISANEPA